LAGIFGRSSYLHLELKMEMQHKLIVDMLIRVKDGHERVCIKMGAISEFSCGQVL
jgi:hypothetical protein